MKRLLASVGVAVMLGLTATVALPPQAAEATALLACSNSLTCNPANAPILTELGIITTPAGTTAVAPAVAGSAAAAGVNWSGVWTAAAGAFLGGSSLLGAVYMGSNGWSGQKLEFDPDYTVDTSLPLCRQVSEVPSGNWVAASPTCGTTVGMQVDYAPNPDLRQHAAAFELYDIAPVPGGFAGRSAITVKWKYLGGPRTSTGSWSDFFDAGWSVRCYGPSGVQLGGSPNGSMPSTGTTGTLTISCGGGDVNSRLRLYARAPRESLAETQTQGSAWGVVYDTTTGSLAKPNAGVSGDVLASITCKKADGTTYDKHLMDTFVKTGPAPIAIPDVRCDGNDLAIDGTVQWRPTGTIDWLDLIEADVPLAVKDWMTEYPDCFNSGTMCSIQLYSKELGKLASCGVIAELCPDWAKTNPDTLLDQFACKYGRYPAPIGMCSALRDPKVGVQPNVDQDGEWLSPTAPTVTPNPKTPEQLEGMGVDLSELIDTKGSGQCWPSGWGVLNPLSWVYMPVACAVEWAFVPSAQTMTEAQIDLQTVLDESIFGDTEQLVDAAASPFLIGSSGCQGPAFRMQIDALPGAGMDQTYYPLSACSGPMVGVAGFFRILSQGFVLIGSGLAALRYFASIAGFVGPGSTGSATSTSSVRFRESA